MIAEVTGEEARLMSRKHLGAGSILLFDLGAGCMYAATS